MYAEIFLTDKCNMRCTFCGAWLESDSPREIPIERAREFLRAVSSLGCRHVTLSGGEPLLYGSLAQLIEYATNVGLFVNILTNGTLIDDSYIKLVKNRNVCTRVSLHTLNINKFNSLTGTKSYERVLKSIDLLKSQHLYFGIGSTIGRENIDEVDRLASFAFMSEAAYIRFTPIYKVNRGVTSDLDNTFVRMLLYRITESVLRHYDCLDTNLSGGSMKYEQLMNELVQPCSAADSYMALDQELELMGCSILPRYFDEVPSRRFSCINDTIILKGAYDEVITSVQKSHCNGICENCVYRTKCCGGCISTKLQNGLGLADGQPLCIYDSIISILDKYSLSDRNRIISYWMHHIAGQEKQLTSNRRRGCMRRLPIWELRFARRYGNNLYLQ